jgi:hypothetical protein
METENLGYRNVYKNITEEETDLVCSSRNNDDGLVAVIFDLKSTVKTQIKRAEKNEKRESLIVHQYRYH